MATTIRMYYFSKKLNSTKTPDANETYYEYECLFLDSQSVMNPVITIDHQAPSVIRTDFTYAYIPDLSRFYFVNNCVISESVLCTYYLQVDVLGTYKLDFLDTTQYVLRSTNLYNDDLVDNLYPLVPMSTDESKNTVNQYVGNEVFVLNNKTGEWATRDLLHSNYTNGAILFGVTGQGDVSCDHYVTTVSRFKTFINDVVTRVPTGGSWGNIPTGVQTALSNFLQYITYVKWIPFFPIVDNLGSLITSLYLGDQSFSLVAYNVEAGLNNQPVRFHLSVPDHPLYNEHHYYNLAPFREVNLFYPLIGNIPLDTTKLHKVNSGQTVFVHICMIIDLATADVEYTIIRSDSNYISSVNGFTDNILANGITNIGVDLSLSEYSMSIEAAIASGMSYIASNALNEYLASRASQSSGGSAIHTSSSGSTHGGHGGNISTPSEYLPTVVRLMRKANSVSNAVQSITPKSAAFSIYDIIGSVVDLAPIADALGSFSSYVSSSFGQVSTSGHTGSFLMSVCTSPVIYCWFMKHADEDYPRFGRPYSDTAVLNTISGFCVCRGANYSGSILRPLKPEMEAINKLLNTGIYIEET